MNFSSGSFRRAAIVLATAVLLLALPRICAAQPTASAAPATGEASPSAAPQESVGPSKFDRLVTGIVLDNLPKEIVEDKDWGKSKRVWDGVRMEWVGSRLETERRWKTVNHGTWKKYEIRLIDPEQRFQVQVDNLQPLEGGRVGFDAQVDAALDVSGRIAQWERGVQLFSLGAEATAVVRLRIGCSMAMKLDPTRFPPDVRFQPQVESADLRLVHFRLRRISQASGPVIRELGSAVKDFAESKIADRRDQLVKRVNRQIEKHQDDLRLSIHDLLASKWGGLAAEQLRPAAQP